MTPSAMRGCSDLRLRLVAAAALFAAAPLLIGCHGHTIAPTDHEVHGPAQVNGPLHVHGSLTVNGPAMVRGEVTAQDTTVNGPTWRGHSFHAAGPDGRDIDHSLQIDGPLRVNGALSVDGALVIHGPLSCERGQSEPRSESMFHRVTHMLAWPFI